MKKWLSLWLAVSMLFTVCCSILVSAEANADASYVTVLAGDYKEATLGNTGTHDETLNKGAYVQWWAPSTATYEIQIEEPGMYRFTMWGEAVGDTSKTSVSVNGTEAATAVSFPSTGATWAEVTTKGQVMCETPLEAGTHLVTFTSKGGSMQFRSFTYEKVGEMETKVMASSYSNAFLSNAGVHDESYNKGSYLQWWNTDFAEYSIEITDPGVYQMTMFGRAVNDKHQNSLLINGNAVAEKVPFTATGADWATAEVQGTVMSDVIELAAGTYTVKFLSTAGGGMHFTHFTYKKVADLVVDTSVKVEASAYDSAFLSNEGVHDENYNKGTYLQWWNTDRASYNLNVEATGVYKVTMFGRAINDKHTNSLHVDGAAVAENIAFLATGESWDTAETKGTVLSETVALTRGSHTLEFLCTAGDGMHFTHFAYEKVGELATDDSVELKASAYTTAFLEKDGQHDDSLNHDTYLQWWTACKTGYSLYIPEDGLYTVNIKGVTTNDSTVNTFMVDGVTVAEEVPFLTTGDNWEPANAKEAVLAQNVYLDRGTHYLEIVCNAGSGMHFYAFSYEKTGEKPNMAVSQEFLASSCYDSFLSNNGVHDESYNKKTHLQWWNTNRADYRVRVPESGIYTVSITGIATNDKTKNSLTVDGKTVLENVTFAATDADWSAPVGGTQVVGDVRLEKGTHYLSFLCTAGSGMNFQKVKLEKKAALTESANTLLINGHLADTASVLHAGYFDTTADAVDEGDFDSAYTPIEVCGSAVTLLENEWTRYFVFAQKAGWYDFTARYSALSGVSVSAFVSGKEVIAAGTASGEDSAYLTLSLGKVYLHQGDNEVKVKNTGATPLRLSELKLSQSGKVTLFQGEAIAGNETDFFAPGRVSARVNLADDEAYVNLFVAVYNGNQLSHVVQGFGAQPTATTNVSLGQTVKIIQLENVNSLKPVGDVVELVVRESAAVRTSIYVDAATGNDANPGTENAPLATIFAAKDLVNTQNDNMTEDITVYIKGTQYLDRTLAFTEEDSASNGKTITYTSWGNEKANLTMGKTYTGFTLHDKEKNIYKVYVGEGVESRQAFFNGKKGIRARSVAGFQNVVYNDTEWFYEADNPELLAFQYPTEVELVYNIAWTEGRSWINGVEDLGNGRVKVLPNQEKFARQADRIENRANGDDKYPAYFENAYELLDVSREWYLDSHNGYLYYIPAEGEDMESMTLTLPVGVQAITVKGNSSTHQVEGITFDNLIISDTGWTQPNRDRNITPTQNHVYSAKGNTVAEPCPAAVLVENARNINFTNNKFTRLGINGLTLQRAIQHCNVVGNEFCDISGTAVFLGTPGDNANPVAPEEFNAYNKVNNNYIHNIGTDYSDSAAIAAGWPKHSQISHNEIANIPYTAIHVGWGWASFAETGTAIYDLEIGYNYIRDVLNDRLYDGGGIYLLGATSKDAENDKNRVVGNYFENIRNAYAAVYPDEGSTNWAIENNVTDLRGVKAWEYNFASKTNGADLYWLMLHADTITGVVANGNYSTHAYVRDDTTNGTNAIMETVSVPDANWDETAQGIIDASGIEESYRANFNLDAQKSFVAETRGYVLKNGETKAFDVSVIGRYLAKDAGNAVSYYVSDERLLTVENGVMKAAQTGSGTVWVMAVAEVGGVTQVKQFRVQIG